MSFKYSIIESRNASFASGDIGVAMGKSLDPYALGWQDLIALASESFGRDLGHGMARIERLDGDDEDLSLRRLHGLSVLRNDLQAIR